MEALAKNIRSTREGLKDGSQLFVMSKNFMHALFGHFSSVASNSAQNQL